MTNFSGCIVTHFFQRRSFLGSNTLRGKKNLINKYYEKSHTMPVLAYAYYIRLFWPNETGTSY